MIEPERLHQQLNLVLPGPAAQLSMAPLGREIDVQTDSYHDAAVLIALHRREGEWCFPLIVRVEDEYAHGGQIGLPGGRVEVGESFIDCALRESEEEISLPVSGTEVLGALTPLAVPVSQHLIHPFVGISTDGVRLEPDHREVAEILFMPVRHFLDSANMHIGEVSSGQRRLVDVPYFALNEHIIWGATAMILAELRQVLLEM